MTDVVESDFPAAWRPDQDDDKTIKGKVIGVSMSPDFGFGPYPIVTIRDDSGQERAIHAMHQILRTELATRRPNAGDDLEVTYLGRRAPKSGNGNPFHVYRVKGGKEPEFNWDNELPSDERPVASAGGVPIDPSPTSSAPAGGAPVPSAPAPAERAKEQFGDDVPF